MRNATEENRQAGESTCPSWCIESGTCRGDHIGQVWGTVATGSLLPKVHSIEPPTFDTVCVRAQFPESDDCPRGVALFGAQHGDDWEIALTAGQAVELWQALRTAIEEAGRE